MTLDIREYLSEPLGHLLRIGEQAAIASAVATAAKPQKLQHRYRRSGARERSRAIHIGVRLLQAEERALRCLVGHERASPPVGGDDLALSGRKVGECRTHPSEPGVDVGDG